MDKSLWFEVKLVLEPEQFKRLQEQAVSRSISVSEYIRRILNQFSESESKNKDNLNA